MGDRNCLGVYEGYFLPLRGMCQHLKSRGVSEREEL